MKEIKSEILEALLSELSTDTYARLYINITDYIYISDDNKNIYYFNSNRYNRIDDDILINQITKTININKQDLKIKLNSIATNIIKQFLNISSKSSLLESIKRILRTEFIKPIDTNNKNIIVFNDGILNLKTLKLKKITPDDYITENIKLSFNINNCNVSKQKEEIKEALYRTCNDDEETYNYILNMLAAGLTREKKEALFFNFTGVGGNGKTFIMELGEAVFESKYIKKLDNNAIYKKSNNRHKALNKINKLKALSFGYFDELKDQSIDTEKIKDLSGGRGIESEQLYKNESENIDINNYIVLISNYPLRFRAEGESLKRRGRTIEFNNIFHQNKDEYEKHKDEKGHYLADKDLIDKVKQDNNYKVAFIKLLFNGFKNYYKNNGITGGEKFKKAFEEVNDNNDYFKEFIDKYYIKCKCVDCTAHKQSFEDILIKHNLEYNEHNKYNRQSLIIDLKRTGIKYNTTTRYKEQRGTIYGLINKNERETVKEMEQAIEDDKDKTIIKLQQEIEALKETIKNQAMQIEELKKMEHKQEKQEEEQEEQPVTIQKENLDKGFLLWD